MATLRHILSGCRTSLSQGRYTWWHNHVLNCIAAAIERRVAQVNSVGIRTESVVILLFREGEKGRGGKFSDRYGLGQLRGANDW